jgi:UDP-N-acetyl-2-amino-2-deoxyglucuronate dehydrogenase
MTGGREQAVRQTFALIGAAGYVADKHLKAIKTVGGDLRAAFDRSDSVGRLDAHATDVRFFTEFERFAEYLEQRRQQGQPIDYVSICSPNHLHKPHATFALRAGSAVICEKPLVLDPAEIDELAAVEQATGRRLNAILQLRLHEAIIALRDRIRADTSARVYDAALTYVTRRGLWYYTSWKGDEAKSGGIAFNIGVHFFDMLSFVFGRPHTNIVHHRAMDCAAGYLEYERLRVSWFLSINGRDRTGQAGHADRFLDITGLDRFDFSKGFDDLHDKCYQEIIAGRGFPLDHARPAIETVAQIRAAPAEPAHGRQHPMLARVLADKGRYRDGWPV